MEEPRHLSKNVDPCTSVAVACTCGSFRHVLTFTSLVLRTRVSRNEDFILRTRYNFHNLHARRHGRCLSRSTNTGLPCDMGRCSAVGSQFARDEPFDGDLVGGLRQWGRLPDRRNDSFSDHPTGRTRPSACNSVVHLAVSITRSDVDRPIDRVRQYRCSQSSDSHRVRRCNSTCPGAAIVVVASTFRPTFTTGSGSRDCRDLRSQNVAEVL